MLVIGGTLSEAGGPSGAGPRVGPVRLRALSEAECYTRCYGGKPGERITVVKVLSAAERRAVRPQQLRRTRIVREERAA
jgi:hypothetical protein